MQSIRLQDYSVYSDNLTEYHELKREIWGYHLYYLDPEEYPELAKPGLRILDAGAHIGLTTLYYAKMYKDPEITALEPNPESFNLLKKNVFENQLPSVVVEQVALSDRRGKELLYRDRSGDRWYSTAGFTEGAWNEEQESERVLVKTKPLRDYLELQDWDIIKLDVEGAEEKVLLAAKSVIQNCSHYLVEFHPIGKRGMGKIVGMFEERGYEVTVTTKGKEMPWHKARGLSMIVATKRE